VTAPLRDHSVGTPRVIGDLRYGTPTDAAAAAQRLKTTNMRVVEDPLQAAEIGDQHAHQHARRSAAEHARFEDAPADARFATSVAAFGEILRGGRYTGSFAYDDVLRVATAARGGRSLWLPLRVLQLVRAAKTASALRPSPR